MPERILGPLIHHVNVWVERRAGFLQERRSNAGMIVRADDAKAAIRQGALVLSTQGAVEVEGGANEGEVGKGLGEISEGFTVIAGFLSIQPQMV